MTLSIRFVVHAAAVMFAGLSTAAPSLAQSSVAALTEALAAACSTVDEAAERDGSPAVAACRDAIEAAFAAAADFSTTEQETLGLAFVEAVNRGPATNPNVPGRLVMPLLAADLRGGIATACTEGYRGSAPKLEECLAVTRTALAASPILSKAEITGIGEGICQVPAFAPPDFHDPLIALLDEAIARAASGADPVIAGDFTEVAKLRGPESTTCR